MSDECLICLEEICPEKRVVCVMQCKKPFHAACISKWFLTKDTCPACRTVWTVKFTDEADDKETDEMIARILEFQSRRELVNSADDDDVPELVPYSQEELSHPADSDDPVELEISPPVPWPTVLLVGRRFSGKSQVAQRWIQTAGTQATADFWRQMMIGQPAVSDA